MVYILTVPPGEKIVPLPQEAHISLHPMVHGCLMFGRQREQAGLLVELEAEHAFSPDDEAALIAFRNKIW